MTFIDGKTLQVHEFIRDKFSPVVSTTQHDATESSPSTHFYISSKAGQVIIHFLYTGKVELPEIPTDLS